MIVEETEETPKRMICGKDDSCQHLVANFDRSFLECHEGDFYTREHEFQDQVQQTLTA